MPVTETNQQCPKRNIYISLKFKFYLKPILKNQNIHTYQNLLLLHIPWIAMLLGFINTMIRNKRKLLSLILLPLLFLPTSPFFWEKCILPYFLENKQNSNPHPFSNVGEIQINYKLLQIKAVITKTFNFKFENVLLLNFQKNINKTCY